jgi:hypothetical protein
LSELKAISGRNCVAFGDQTVDEGADEAVNMLEDDGPIVMILLTMLPKVCLGWVINAPQFGLNDDGTFVRRQSEINCDGVSYAVRPVQLLIESLLSRSDAELFILLSLDQV